MSNKTPLLHIWRGFYLEGCAEAKAPYLLIFLPSFKSTFFTGFTKSGSMNEQYSNLELVRYDDTARAPERDYEATAFEPDASALAPQVCTT